MPRRAAIAATLAAGLAAFAAAAPGPAGAARTEVVAGLGHTFAVPGEPGNGGVSLALSLLWPIEERFRIGVMGFADDLGEEVDRLIGPGGEDLGPVGGTHRASTGGLLRMEAHWPGRRFAPFVSAFFGMYRIGDDVQGTDVSENLTPGYGAGLGAQYPLNAHHAVALTVRGQFLTRGVIDGYMSAALEWRWGIGGLGEGGTNEAK
jgi:hypothetical protein